VTKVRRVVRWSLAGLLAVRLITLVCAASGATMPTFVPRVMEATILAPLAACAWLFAGDYRRHRRTPLRRRAAAEAAAQDTFPLALRRLAVHEIRLFTSFLRWAFRRGPHGVTQGDLAVRYAAGQAFLVIGLLMASIVETVALALVVPWPAVRAIVLFIDLWGVYFVIALQASCVVRPHVVRADGSLLLRYGALAEIAVPAGLIARVWREDRFDRGGFAKVYPDGSAAMGMGGQTMVTVELTEPVRFIRPLGAQAQAQVLRFYAGDPAAAVEALRGRERRLSAADAGKSP
jgi:hypothetical protein